MFEDTCGEGWKAGERHGRISERARLRPLLERCEAVHSMLIEQDLDMLLVSIFLKNRERLGLDEQWAQLLLADLRHELGNG